jgi:translation initiation factor 3 subunit E
LIVIAELCSLPQPRSDLSARLNLTREEGEKWIVNLIRDTRLEGKIDLNANMLHITRPFNPPSQAILAITRDIAESANTMNWAMQSSAGTGGNGGGQGGGGGKGGRGGAQGGRGGRKEGEQQQQQAVEAK